MSPSPASIVEPERRIEVHGAYEVVVLGGGPAGIAAAATAARHGRKTLLVERYGFLGGMGTAAGVTNFCGLFANVHGDIRQVVHGVADDLLGRIERLGGLNAPHVVLGKTKAQAYDTAAYKCAADDLLMSHRAEVLFHALAASVTMTDDGAIAALVVETKSGRGAVLGEVFIDCSGDGDLAAWAGAPFELGDGAGNLLYPTAMFRVSGVDPGRAGEAWRSIPERMEAAVADGAKFPRKGAIVRPQRNPTEWRVNVTQLARPNGQALDGTDAAELSQGEIDGRRQIVDYFAFLRSVPGFEDSYIVDIPPQIGIRETRRIMGSYELTADDVLGCASFADTIGVNGWPIEAHVAGDVLWRWPEIPASRGFNHLPYRMLLPHGVGNLLVAGRCASMTHEAQSAARVSGACFVMGEAAATAAHLALASAQPLADIPVDALQRLLEEGGAYLGRDV